MVQSMPRKRPALPRKKGVLTRRKRKLQGDQLPLTPKRKTKGDHVVMEGSFVLPTAEQPGGELSGRWAFSQLETKLGIPLPFAYSASQPASVWHPSHAAATDHAPEPFSPGRSPRSPQIRTADPDLVNPAFVNPAHFPGIRSWAGWTGPRPGFYTGSFTLPARVGRSPKAKAAAKKLADSNAAKAKAVKAKSVKSKAAKAKAAKAKAAKAKAKAAKATGVKPTGVKPTGVKPTGVKPVGVKPVGVKPSSVKAVSAAAAPSTPGKNALSSSSAAAAAGAPLASPQGGHQFGGQVPESFYLMCGKLGSSLGGQVDECTISGRGQNQFGHFELTGKYNLATQTLRCSKYYLASIPQRMKRARSGGRGGDIMSSEGELILFYAPLHFISCESCSQVDSLFPLS